jgi:hypothetical protein
MTRDHIEVWSTKKEGGAPGGEGEENALVSLFYYGNGMPITRDPDYLEKR